MDSNEKLKKNNNYFWINGICLPEPSISQMKDCLKLLKVGKFALSHY